MTIDVQLTPDDVKGAIICWLWEQGFSCSTLDVSPLYGDMSAGLAVTVKCRKIDSQRDDPSKT